MARESAARIVGGVGLFGVAVAAAWAIWRALQTDAAIGAAPRTVPRGMRRALRAAVAAAGGWDADPACRRALGRRPHATWARTGAIVREIENASGLDFGALDPGSVALRDEFCKRLELRGRCPAGPRGAWRTAVALALGQGGRRFAGLIGKPAWQAIAQAFTDETGQALPVPAGAERIARYDAEFDRCVTDHRTHIDQLVAEASAPPPF